VLEAAGLVRSEKRGTFVVYTLQSNVLEDLAAEIYELSSGLGLSRPAGEDPPRSAGRRVKGSPS
jgi:hypothetical protein